MELLVNVFGFEINTRLMGLRIQYGIVNSLLSVKVNCTNSQFTVNSSANCWHSYLILRLSGRYIQIYKNVKRVPRTNVLCL